jgi:hypothetical protein
VVTEPVIVRGPFEHERPDKRRFTVTVRRGALLDQHRFFTRQDADALVARLIEEGATHVSPGATP